MGVHTAICVAFVMILWYGKIPNSELMLSGLRHVACAIGGEMLGAWFA